MRGACAWLHAALHSPGHQASSTAGRQLGGPPRALTQAQPLLLGRLLLLVRRRLLLAGAALLAAGRIEKLLLLLLIKEVVALLALAARRRAAVESGRRRSVGERAAVGKRAGGGGGAACKPKERCALRHHGCARCPHPLCHAGRALGRAGELGGLCKLCGGRMRLLLCSALCLLAHPRLAADPTPPRPPPSALGRAMLSGRDRVLHLAALQGLAALWMFRVVCKARE